MHGYQMREIAQFLGLHYSTVSRRIRQAEKRNTWLLDLTPNLTTNLLRKNKPQKTGKRKRTFSVFLSEALNQTWEAGVVYLEVTMGVIFFLYMVLAG